MTYVYATIPVFEDQGRDFLSFRTENFTANGSGLLELREVDQLAWYAVINPCFRPWHCQGNVTLLDMPSCVTNLAGLCVAFGKTL